MALTCGGAGIWWKESSAPFRPRAGGCRRVFGCFGAPPAGIAGAERPQQLQHCLRWGWLHDAQTPKVFFLGQEQPLCYRTPAAPISAHRCHGFHTPAQQGGIHTQTELTAARSVHQVNHKTSARLLLATSCTFPLLHPFLTPLLPSQSRILTHRGFRWPCTVLPYLSDTQGSYKTPLLGGRHTVAPPQWYKPTPFPHQTRF